MSGPRVSIVMPVCNAGDTVAEAIESCLRQSMDSFELIVVLDGCTDRSGEIVRSYRDSRIRVFEMDHQGVAPAAREAILASRTDFIARMDADDISHPERLSSQYHFLSESSAFSAVSGQVHLLNPLGEGMQRYVDWVNGLETAEDIARERFVECPVIQPSLMMRRSSFQEVKGYREVEWAEDHDLFLRMLEREMRIGKVEGIVLSWRDSAVRLTRTHPAYAEEQVWRMKAHHLARESGVASRGVAICGAGPIGKRLARLLKEEGVEVHGFFEVNPRRVGEKIGGVPVAGSEAFGERWRGAVLLSAVGVEGGRARVRRLAREEGYTEGLDFWCCC
ncbi:MAG: glycosyltransferase [Roseibacillus sp.]|nr:glycosyltransferase [Roseibacillus sp.]MDP7106541.1 glycosyltransferase [Roseibacillus sp.]MDP7308790.1 glycosyltransferase [Roseibacillus sp.]MDP7655132.1 glycosyltransferase [Roseibacillus sp.]HJM63908.1 glycosyltransferase [Roseibacillus sp.]